MSYSENQMRVFAAKAWIRQLEKKRAGKLLNIDIKCGQERMTVLDEGEESSEDLHFELRKVLIKHLQQIVDSKGTYGDTSG